MKNNLKRGIVFEDNINSKNKKSSKETKNFNFQDLNYFINSKSSLKVKKKQNKDEIKKEKKKNKKKKKKFFYKIF